MHKLSLLTAPLVLNEVSRSLKIVCEPMQQAQLQWLGLVCFVLPKIARMVPWLLYLICKIDFGLIYTMKAISSSVSPTGRSRPSMALLTTSMLNLLLMIAVALAKAGSSA